MKILIIMDPGIMIPVKGYGGHERLAEMFAKEYQRLGHEVHLLITGGSTVANCTVHNFGKEGFPPNKWDALGAIPVAWKFLWKHRKDFDLVHNFGRLAYLIPILNLPVKKIMTYGREISPKNIRTINTFNKKNIAFTACSHNLLSRINAEGYWEVVCNAIEFNKYTLRENPGAGAPLIFLGRIERVKGCHTAIRVAKATNNNLIIAGNISPLAKEKLYFENEIMPHIDGKQIQYVGELNDAQKNEYLGRAKALLLPIEWNEPFGIVMIEAMACGTPVIAYTRGSVNEVIDEGITGYKVNDFTEMVDALKNISSVDRTRCRQQAKKRFDVKIIAGIYLQLVNEPAKKIVIITTSNPSANPRVVKEYETLLEMGYKIKVLYSYNAYWSYKNDEISFATGALKRRDFVMVGGNPFNGKLEYFISRVLFKILRNVIGILPFPYLRKISTYRCAFLLKAAAKKYKADIYIAHYLGSLPAAISAAKKYRSKVIFDAEDFHRGEDPYFPLQIKNVIGVEEDLIPKVNIITTASPLITVSLQKLFPGNKIYTINNVFSRKFIQYANRNNNEKLRLFWFSQNLGPNRGLEIFIKALNHLQGCNIDLTIMGTIWSQRYKNKLMALADDASRLYFEETIPPDEIFAKASQYDIGLAGEIPNRMNKDVCLSNKIFTYLLAGNCLIASDTAGQKYFLECNPGIGLLYKHDDAADLASKIKKIYDDRPLLEACKKNALHLSSTTLNWETESEKLKEIINSLDRSNIRQPVDPMLQN